MNVTVATTGNTPISIEKEANMEIQTFSDWFEKLGNSPLVGAEIAILKTYLGYKAGIYKDRG
jgi:hypothetical protein